MSVAGRVLGAFFFAVLVPAVAVAAPLGRSFTYQGQLSQSGTPVDGTVHLRFSLWDAAGTGTPPTGGTQIGASQIVTDVSVDDGLFTAEVNAGDAFGATAFNGQARWLQVEVCTDGTCASTTVLGPRQSITATPYALGPWYINGTSLSYTGGNVGIGTASPAAPLHVTTPGEGLRLQGTSGTAWISFNNAAGTALGYVGDGSSGDNSMYLTSYNDDVHIYTLAGAAITAKSTGLVGIGTPAPTAKLDVRGSIRLGASGEYEVPGVVENLKIVRGTVSAAGNLLPGMGSSISVNLVLTGVYTIAFTPAFSGRPTIAVTCESTGPDRIAMLDSVINGSCTVRIVSGSGTPVNCQFDLIAIGRR